MSTMRSVRTSSPGRVEIREVDRPGPGPRDVLVRVRACGICGTDTFFVASGGMAYPGAAPVPVALGHEPAGEVVEVGAQVRGISVGDHVVVDPMAAPSGLIGTGGPWGAMSEYLLVEDAERGRTLQVIDPEVPFAVAALNEPMAVARRGVNRAGDVTGQRVVVFGAGPIGLGAAIWFRLAGAAHVVVVDVVADRLRTALAVGADAVVDSSAEDLAERLLDLHGEGRNALGQKRSGTDVWFDAAGVPQVFDAVQASAKWGARLVVVAVHKKPVDVSGFLRSELTLIGSMGYPDEIFEVTPLLAQHWRSFEPLISHRIGFDEVQSAYELALTPGAAEKVVVTFD